MPVHELSDIVYASAISHQTNALGVAYENVNDAQRGQFIHHQKFVLLSQMNREEIQRCASLGVPVILHVHSLQESFDTFKMSSVKLILFVARGNIPFIDYGWMSKAFEEKKSVVFSLVELQRAFASKDASTLQEYRKMAQLLHKSKIPLGLVSFAREEKDVLSEEEVDAWAGYLNVPLLSVQWYL
jgi:hypothetical protein